ncbi:MAG: ABC transporter substrate-binding protein [Chloroflexi bacterium]|nr:ABC transporter substrate-binding protein [Chloroflexota bacterium]
MNSRYPILFLGALVLIVVACSPTPAGPQGTLTIALSAEAESLDPFFTYQAAGYSYAANIFDNLVERNFNGEFVPGLATEWTVVDDTTVQFKLRQGVTFHNGEAFTAESVKFTVQRMLDEEVNSGARNNFLSIDFVEVVDDFTVLFHLNRPDGALFENLAAGNLPMLPPVYFEEVEAEGFALNPVGTGPFKFVSWTRDEALTLEANENYWSGSYKGMPLVQTLIFRPITEATTRFSELQTGGAQIMQDLLPDQTAQAESAGLRVVPRETGQYAYVFLTADVEGPLADPQVRQALNYGVNVEGIISTVLGGFGSRIASPIGPVSFGHNPDVAPYTYDLEMARSLLAEAGFADGFDITMDICTCDPLDPIQAVAGELANLGINVTLNPLELAQFNDNWIARTQSPMWFARWGGSPDPASIVFFAACDGFISRFCNEEATALIHQAESTVDQNARAQVYRDLSQILHDDPLGIYLWTATSLYGVRAEVQGFTPHVNLIIVASNVSVSS